MVLYADAACCVYFNLWNYASFIFVVSDTNIGDRLGGIILSGGLVYDCWIGLYTLGGGLVLFDNGGSGWDIVWF